MLETFIPINDKIDLLLYWKSVNLLFKSFHFLLFKYKFLTSRFF